MLTQIENLMNQEKSEPIDVKQFFSQIPDVWKKIEWPTPRQLFIQITVTIAVTVFSTLVIYAIDLLFSSVISLISQM